MGEVVKEKEKSLLLTVVLCLLMFFSFAQTVNDLRPTVTMKEYVDMQVEFLKKMGDLRDEHHKEINRIKEESIKTAYASQDKRLDGMNEFRQTLEDSNKTYVTWQALIGLIIGVSGFLFGYANYKKNKDEAAGGGSGGSKSKNIISGDKVEVTK